MRYASVLVLIILIGCLGPAPGNYEKELRQNLGGSWQVAYCRVNSKEQEPLLVAIASHQGPQANYLFSVKRTSIQEPYTLTIDTTPRRFKLECSTNASTIPENSIPEDTWPEIKTFAKSHGDQFLISCQKMLGE